MKAPVFVSCATHESPFLKDDEVIQGFRNKRNALFLSSINRLGCRSQKVIRR